MNLTSGLYPDVVMEKKGRAHALPGIGTLKGVTHALDVFLSLM